MTDITDKEKLQRMAVGIEKTWLDAAFDQETRRVEVRCNFCNSYESSPPIHPEYIAERKKGLIENLAHGIHCPAPIAFGIMNDMLAEHDMLAPEQSDK